MAKITIAIDCMGGDFGPLVFLPAIKHLISRPTLKLSKTRVNCKANRVKSSVLENWENDIIHFQLFGNREILTRYLETLKLTKYQNIEIFDSTDDVLMTDRPSQALKKKKNSSMWLALKSVGDGNADACVSAGNTGALMAISRFILKMLPGMDRPAIVSALPTILQRPVHLLDLGANVDCNEHRLTQFAIMGNELCKRVDGIKSPKVALLNVGEEENKGSDRLRLAAKMIDQLENVNFCGFVEANQIFSGDYQVIVTDGFTGNSVLKASEGLSEFLLVKIKDAFQKNWWTRFIGLVAKPVMNIFKEEINPEGYNGACLIGLRGVVIKSHGSANVNATVCAIEEAILQSKQKLPERIRESLDLGCR